MKTLSKKTQSELNENDNEFIGRRGHGIDFFDEHPDELVKYAKTKGMILKKEATKEKTKIVIQIDGGNVSYVYANHKDVEIVIVDNDNGDAGGDRVGYLLAPDKVSDPIRDLYNDNNAASIEIREDLKRKKF